MMSLRIHRALLCAGTVAALAAVPTTAGAATITGGPGGTYTYVAAPGEINNIDIQGSDGTRDVTFYGPDAVKVTSAPADCTPSSLYGTSVMTCTDAAAVVLQAGDGGEQVKVSGSLPLTIPVTIDAGAGDDLVEAGYGADQISGGPGNDKIKGFSGDDTIDGGDGSDEIGGGSGADHIAGGAGDDVLRPDEAEDPSADVVDGGPGTDTVEGDYSSRFRSSSLPPEALSFTFAGGADDGRPGENDDLRSIERLSVHSGGRFVGSDAGEYVKLVQTGQPGELIGNGGDDDLNAGDGPDKLDGGPGNDHLDGGFGDDVITGGPGQDRISGDLAGGDCGPLWCKYPYGNDTINAQDGEVDTIVCGFGTDTVIADAADVVDKDCETVTRGAAAPTTATPGRTVPGAGGGGATTGASVALAAKVTIATALKSGFTVKVTGVKAGTALKLSATRSAKVVARGSGRASRSGTATVKLRFTKKARRGLRHARTITLKVGGSGVTATITLKRR
jgi:hypothetical protein